MLKKVTEIGVSSDAWLGCCRRHLPLCNSFAATPFRRSQSCREYLHTPPLSRTVNTGSFRDIVPAVGRSPIAPWRTLNAPRNRHELDIRNAAKLSGTGAARLLFDSRHIGIFTREHRARRIIKVSMGQVGYSA